MYVKTTKIITVILCILKIISCVIFAVFMADSDFEMFADNQIFSDAFMFVSLLFISFATMFTAGFSPYISLPFIALLLFAVIMFAVAKKSGLKRFAKIYLSAVLSIDTFVPLSLATFFLLYMADESIILIYFIWIFFINSLILFFFILTNVLTAKKERLSDSAVKSTEAETI